MKYHENYKNIFFYFFCHLEDSSFLQLIGLENDVTNFGVKKVRNVDVGNFTNHYKIVCIYFLLTSLYYFCLVSLLLLFLFLVHGFEKYFITQFTPFPTFSDLFKQMSHFHNWYQSYDSCFLFNHLRDNDYFLQLILYGRFFN